MGHSDHTPSNEILWKPGVLGEITSGCIEDCDWKKMLNFTYVLQNPSVPIDGNCYAV